MCKKVSPWIRGHKSTQPDGWREGAKRNFPPANGGHKKTGARAGYPLRAKRRTHAEHGMWQTPPRWEKEYPILPGSASGCVRDHGSVRIGSNDSSASATRRSSWRRSDACLRLRAIHHAAQPLAQPECPRQPTLPQSRTVSRRGPPVGIPHRLELGAERLLIREQGVGDLWQIGESPIGVEYPRIGADIPIKSDA